MNQALGYSSFIIGSFLSKQHQFALLFGLFVLGVELLAQLRERFGLLPGTEVEFVPETDALRIKPRKRGRRAATAADAWLVKAAGSAATKLSTDQIMATTRGED